MSNQSRRSFMVQSGQVMLGTVIGSQLLTAQAEEQNASGEALVTTAGVDKICVNCEYWGGVRKVSEDGKQITGTGKGWCNNPASMNYQKQTTPSAGPMPAWKKWGALS